MHLKFQPVFLPADGERLISFLTSDEWPFHVNPRPSSETISEAIREGVYAGSNHECFWILSDEKEIIGFLRLFDLDDIDDGYPLFDLRVLARWRGRGVGKSAVHWLTKYLFEKYPCLERIAGTTRADNIPMRKTFTCCGFVKEGHYREDWPAQNGLRLDTVKYAILRKDWISGSLTPVIWHDDPS